MAEHCKISTPFKDGVAPAKGMESAGGTFNHHTTPAFDKPRDGGKELPMQFFSGLKGTPTPVTSPMQGITGPVGKKK